MAAGTVDLRYSFHISTACQWWAERHGDCRKGKYLLSGELTSYPALFHGQIFHTEEKKEAKYSITGRGIDLNYRDVEWFALETNRDHSVILDRKSVV